jgi:hypothetical protein
MIRLVLYTYEKRLEPVIFVHIFFGSEENTGRVLNVKNPDEFVDFIQIKLAFSAEFFPQCIGRNSQLSRCAADVIAIRNHQCTQFVCVQHATILFLTQLFIPVLRQVFVPAFHSPVAFLGRIQYTSVSENNQLIFS